jgi:peptidoglycan/xylan/chitin deacetylase (PgdA/CDA1 family)
MPISSKRHRLAIGLRKGGLLWALKKLARRRSLLVLNYHRIGSLDGFLLEDGLVSATPEDFRSQVLFLRDHFDLPPLESVLATAEQGFHFPRPTALITFDDGYRDNFELALPILKEAGVPAVFFICPRFVQKNPLPYWDHVAYVFKTMPARSLTLDYPFPFAANLDEEPARAAAVRLLVALGAYPQPVDEARLFEHLEERSGTRVPLVLRSGLFMSWDEVRQMAAAGMAIGSHTLTHPILAFLSEAELRQEMIESRKVLEKEVGQPVQTIAYPYGRPHAYNDLTKRLAREAGYRLGFSYHGGINGPGHEDLFDVRRVPVDHDVTFALFQARTVFYRAFGRALI